MADSTKLDRKRHLSLFFFSLPFISRNTDSRNLGFMKLIDIDLKL